MSIKLNRNLETKRDKEQEEEFSQSMNLGLFFDANKIISKIDGWKYSNIKKFVKNISFSKDLIVEYSNWNKNIELITLKIITGSVNHFKLTPEEKIIFRERDIIKIHEWLENNKDNKNKQFEALLFIVEITNNNHNILKERLGYSDAGANWADYLEYGTTDFKVIELQNIGIPRHLAQYILDNHKECLSFDNNVLTDIKRDLLENNFDKNSHEYKEYQDLFLTR